MKLSTKSIVIAVVIAAFVISIVSLAVFNSMNNIVSTLVMQKIDEQLINLKGQEVRYNDIKLDLFSKSVVIDSLYYSSDIENCFDNNKPGFDIMIYKVSLNLGSLKRAVIDKELEITSIDIDGISSRYMQSHKLDKQERVDRFRNLFILIAKLDVQDVMIRNGSLNLKTIDSKFSVEIESADINAKNLIYSFVDDSFYYNDSVYSIYLKSVRMIDAQGLYMYELGELETRDAKKIEIKNFKYHCLVPKEKLSERLGKISAFWMDVEIENMQTNNFNLVRSVVSRNIKVDTMFVKAKKVDIYKDNTYPPKFIARPFQAILMSISDPIDIKLIYLELPKLLYQQKEKIGGVGQLLLKNNELKIEQVRNRSQHVFNVDFKAKVDDRGGSVSVDIKLQNNDKCSFDCVTKVNNVNMSSFNGIAKPLYGADVKGHISSIVAKYSGDSLTSNGTFTMIYNDFEAKILKDECPLASLAKYSTLVNGIVKAVVPESNPRFKGQAPKSYRISYTRDIRDPYAMAIVLPIVQGVKETFLASFNEKNRIKPERTNKKNNIKNNKSRN